MEKLATAGFVAIFIIVIMATFFMFHQCKADGYNTTKCMMMISGNTHVIGVMQ